MNTGKTFKIAMQHFNIKQKDLAEMINSSPAAFNHICNRDSCNSKIIEKVASALSLKPSSLIALGESSLLNLELEK